MKITLEAGRVNVGLSLEEAAKRPDISVIILKRLEEENAYLKQSDPLLIERICKLYGITAENISV